jgi:hypothetical protein
MSMKFVYAVSAALLLLAFAAPAQTTAFTYQGRLSNGTNPATGVFDFRFQIYNASSSVVAGPLTNAPVGVTNGLFTVALDFGSLAFDGNTRTLEVGVRVFGDTNNYSILSPRQPVLSVPYAVQSLNASNAVTLTAPLQGTNITGTIPDTKLSVNVALLNGNQTFTGANSFNGAVTAGNVSNTFTGAFTGNGFALTNLSTTNLVGILPDARLSTNVALLTSNLVFGGTNKFTGAVTATNPANVFGGTFSGNGGSLTNLSPTNLVGTLPDAHLSANVALLNGNQTFTGAVTATNAANVFTGAYSGSGHGLTNVPGAFFWVTVSGTNVVASPNVGFIVTNDVTPVTITLPSSPSVGDTYKVAGIGAAGWNIAQNTSQNIFSGNLSSSIGQSWKASGPGTANWSAIASSANGTKLAAAVNGGNIYISANSGANWTARASSQNWSSIASSSDGTRLVATAGYTIYNVSATGQIYTSTDSGSNWTARASTLAWSSVASSSDGTKLVASAYGDKIYTSVNSGVNWTPRDSIRNWTAVASSSDGTKLVATVDAIGIYTSSNSGTNWSQVSSNASSWTAVTSSADGTRLVATAGSGVYISTDSGATWVLANSNTPGKLTSVASSSDGSRLVVTAGGSGLSGNVYGSSDSGAIWAQLIGAPNLSWSDVAASADGSQLVATVNGGNIYISSQSSTTVGAAGYLSGGQHSAIELIYTGNGIFLPLNHEGTIRAY